MSNASKIIAGPGDIWIDRYRGTDFDALSTARLNFTEEPVSIENQPELFQLAVDQRSANIRQTLNRTAIVIKTKVSESSLANLFNCFPFAQDSTSNPTVPADEVWIGIGDGSDALKFVSVQVQMANPDGGTTTVYLPRAVVRGSSTIEHKRDGTQGVPIEILAIQPNCAGEDLLDDEGLFAVAGSWSLSSTDIAPTISGGTLNANASTAAETASQNLATALFPRSGGTAGNFQLQPKTKYRLELEVTAWSAGDIDVSLAGETPVSLGITGTGTFSADFDLPGTLSDQVVLLTFDASANLSVDNLRVWPLRGFNIRES